VAAVVATDADLRHGADEEVIELRQIAVRRTEIGGLRRAPAASASNNARARSRKRWPSSARQKRSWLSASRKMGLRETWAD